MPHLTERLYSTYFQIYLIQGYIYDGEWLNDEINGKGCLQMPDGSEYEGEFLSGKFQGMGKYTWKDGSEYSGPFIQNKPEGDGIYNDTDTRKGYFKVFNFNSPAHEVK